MSTVSKMNHKEIPALIDLVDELGVDVYAVGRYCPTNVEKAYDPNIHMTPQEYKAYMDECFERYSAHKDSKTTYQLKDHLWTLYKYEKPIVPGIECVGIVEHSLDDGFKKGDLVCSLMGGLGRNFNGSYEEYAILPVQKLFHISSVLDAEHLAAIPETFFTAWGSLFECLSLQPSDILLVRGATSALGYAAMQIATALGCKVYGTTHKREKMHLIADLGCEAILDSENKLPDGFYANKILELIGPKTIRNSLSHLYHGGIVCNTGILGGEYHLNGFDPIKEIPNGCYLTGFFSNYPTQDVIDKIFAFIDEHKISPFIGASFQFSDIKQAIKAQEKGVDGKIVVVMD